MFSTRHPKDEAVDLDKKIRDKLHLMFDHEVERIRSLHPNGRWVQIWCDYLRSQKDILFGHTDDLIEFFNRHRQKFLDGVLVRDPAMIVGFILVDRDFAEKALVLGLPVDVVKFAESRSKSRKKRAK